MAYFPMMEGANHLAGLKFAGLVVAEHVHDYTLLLPGLGLNFGKAGLL